MTNDQETGSFGRNIGSRFSRPVKQQIDHPRIVSHRFAIFDNFPRSMGDRSGEFKFSRDDRLGEVTFANKVRHDVDIVAFDHTQDLSKARFFLPKAAIDLREKLATNDFVRMLEGRCARIRIQSGTMTYQDERALPLVSHGSKLDGPPKFLKWNSRSAASNRTCEISLQERVKSRSSA